MPANPFPEDRLVAIYPSRRDADAAAEELRSAGIDPALVRVGDSEDLAVSLVGEMRQETGNAWRFPPSGPMTGEQAKGSAMVAPIGAGVGAVLGLVVAALLPLGGIALAGRLAIGAIAGGLFGAVFGMVVGGGLGTRGPATPGAAQGVPVSVARTDDQVLRVLSGRGVQRIDRVAAGGNPIEAVEVDPPGPDSEHELLRDHLQQPTGGDWGSVGPEQPRTEQS